MNTPPQEGTRSAKEAPQKNTANRPRKWWRSGKLWIGVLGTILGAAATLAVNEAVVTLFPETDRMSRLSDAIQGLTGEMRANRDNVSLLARQLGAQEPGSPGAAETARRLERSANDLVQTSDSLAATISEAAGGSRRPEPGPRPAPPTGGGSHSELADSAPPPDLWLPSNQSTLVGPSRNAFGVRGWDSGPAVATEQVHVALNGEAAVLQAGDRLQFPDPNRECYIIYLRTVDPDPSSARGDERHGFALTCTPTSNPPR